MSLSFFLFIFSSLLLLDIPHCDNEPGHKFTVADLVIKVLCIYFHLSILLPFN